MNAFNLKHYGLLVITSLLIIACSSPSTENATKPDVSNLISDTIPFELTSYNNLLIDGLFNQEDTLSLMFHLASESVSITTEGMEKAKSVQWDHSATGSSWGGSGEAKYSAQNQLQIGKSTFDSLGITESKRSGHFSDGKIGYTYWNDKVMHIDFETSQMLLYDTLLQVPEGYDKMEVVEENLSLEEMEKELIRKALKKHKGRRKDAADELGISERTLYRKIKHYEI